MSPSPGRPTSPEPRALRTTVVVPCFDEADRLDPAAFVRCCDEVPGVSFLFVDDGSTDGTGAVLEGLCAQRPHELRLLSLEANRGKAEAVRAGVLEAAREGPDLIGYWDADLATPLEEIPAFVDVLAHRPEIVLVMGSRVSLLGRQIRRRATRHYMGRMFATVTSVALQLPVYDTQCGAKVFRCRADVLDAFAEPFRARWIFDTEVLARLIDAQRRGGGPGPTTTVYELPLRSWSEVAGSKVGLGDYVTASLDIARLYPRVLARGLRARLRQDAKVPRA